jgi:molecular chaperone DnaK (HSP70)
VPRRLVVGIDLGTTHTVVAWADRDRAGPAEIFDIAQLVTPREIEARALFPSCLYAPVASESAVDPWGDAPWIAGELARRRGGEVPGRTVLSAKSWLCHAGVDRDAPILPWGVSSDASGDDSNDAGMPRISPVDASARYLAHVRRAWDEAFADAELADQDVVLTVPASFDEAARELTVVAARRAGLEVRLLEEPQAAFYDFMHRRGRAGIEALLGECESALVLVCDVGGGTTDLSLLRVTREAASAEPRVERVAVGHHLLLGGDNMDLALALTCEARMSPGAKLDAARFAQLVAACRAGKERLLSETHVASVPITLLTTGARLVGGTMTTDLTSDDVERVVVEGFFPMAPKDARPQRTKSALVAFGLPYEKDVAITRHVAWFFARHAPEGAHLGAVLLNGGVFRADKIRQRLVASIDSWGGPPVRVLPHADPDLGVARGAVAHGLSRLGHGPRIEGGAARGYYVGVGAQGQAARAAICVVPRGAAEGVVHIAEGRTLSLTVGRAVRFDLFASDVRRADRAGDVVTLDDESFQTLPPIAVAFDRGQRKRAGLASEEINVVLEGELTPIGTLDLACVEVSASAPRRFRLAFQLREGGAEPGSIAPPSVFPASVAPRARGSSMPPSLGTRRFDEARELLLRAFGKPTTDSPGREAKDLVRELERVLGERASWTTDLARALFDVLVSGRASRRRSADHERVFFLLAGYCVRPGFGDPLDPSRIKELAPLFAERLAFPDQVRGWQQFWIAWRRAAGGLDERAQVAIRDAVDPFIAPSDAGKKKSKKLKPEALEDMLEMASSLERIAAPRRAELGAWILERTWTDRDPRLWAALGRIGARVPAYASVHHVIAPNVAERWLDHLLREKWDTLATASAAAVQLARVTGDRARDVSDDMRHAVEKRLVAAGARQEWIRAVREHVAVDDAERAAFFGEALPVGLTLVE